MTKKDFTFIAEALKASKPQIPSSDRRVWEDVCRTFAGRLADTNPRFDSERFLSACGYGK